MSQKPGSGKLCFEKFRVWEVVVPVRRDILSAPPPQGPTYRDNLSWPKLPIHLIEGATSAGFTAVGESPRGTSREMVEATLRSLLGVDLRSISPSSAWMQPTEPGGLPGSYPIWSWQAAPGRCYALLESLWLDAVGKAAGLPAHQFLGGEVCTEVAVDFWANRPSPKVLRKLVAEAVRRGLRGMKLKSDARGDTVRSLAAIARDVPKGFRFTVDPMCAWRTLRESDECFGALAKLPGPVQVEDPFPYLNVEDWQRARTLKPITIICHARSEEVLRAALREQLADAFNLGGASAFDFARMAAVAEFYAKDCWQGSALELGVLQHLRLHAAACARNCVLASDLQSEWVRAHTLVTPRMAYRNGCAVVPDRPGLGIELDHRAMRRHVRQQFEVS